VKELTTVYKATGAKDCNSLQESLWQRLKRVLDQKKVIEVADTIQHTCIT